jgi:hypothetical protein
VYSLIGSGEKRLSANMADKPTIFLAHSITDVTDAPLIRNLFEELGHDVLLLKLSQHMTKDFLENLLQQEIQARDWLVVIRSEASRQSTWVNFEASFAEERRKPVFEIDLDGCRAVNVEDLEECLRTQVAEVSRRIRVFLSYHRADNDIARRLSEDLRVRGYDVWLDIERISGDQDFRKAIRQAIDRTLYKGALVLLVSARSVESKYVMDELNYALGRKGLVIPCVVNPPPETVPPALQHIQWVDCSVSYEKGLMQLLSALGSQE